MKDQKFETNYIDVREGSIADSETLKPFYDQPGHMRDVCFVWPNGRRLALSYNDLIYKELTDDCELILRFSSAVIKISGYKLETMHRAFVQQLPLYVSIQNEGYQDKICHGSIVTSIEVIADF